MTDKDPHPKTFTVAKLALLAAAGVIIMAPLAMISSDLRNHKDVANSQASMSSDITKAPALCLDMNGIPMERTERLIRDNRTVGYTFMLNGKETIIMAPNEKSPSRQRTETSAAEEVAFHFYRCIDRDPRDLMREMREQQNQTENGKAPTPSPTTKTAPKTATTDKAQEEVEQIGRDLSNGLITSQSGDQTPAD